MLLIASRQLDTKTKHCQMHGEPYEVKCLHTEIAYKINGKKTKHISVEKTNMSNEQVVLAVFKNSKTAMNQIIFEFMEWDKLIELK